MINNLLVVTNVKQEHPETPNTIIKQAIMPAKESM